MRTRLILNALSLIAMIVLISCGQSDSATETARPTNAGVPNQATLAPVAGLGSYIVDQSLKQSIANTELVVIGEVIGMGNVFNSRRDAQDRTQPARDSFGVGQEYQVQVERYLKGSGPAVLTVVSNEGVILSPPEKVTQADIERAKAASGIPPLTVGARYLLLLKSIADYHPGTDYYAGQGQPWRFVLSEDGTGVLVAPSGALGSFPQDFIPHPEAPLIPQVEQLIQAEQATTSP